MSLKRVFCSTVFSCKYIFKSGQVAQFVAGKYYTDNETQIAELEEEIKNGNEFLYVDKNQREVDVNELDPLETIKRKAIEEYIAAQKAANKPENDRGSSATPGVDIGVLSSNKLVEVAIAADSGSKGK